jgi:CBS domain-containing protein
MQVSHVMTRGVEIADPDATIADVARTMRTEDIGALPVGENNRLIGVVTDRDIVVRAVADGRSPAETPVREVMSDHVYYCFDEDGVDRAAEIMAEHQVRRLAVLDQQNKLVGMVALADLCLDDSPAAQAALIGVSTPSH